MGFTDEHLMPVADEGLGNSACLADLGDGRGLVVDACRDMGGLRRGASRRGLRAAFAAGRHLHTVPPIVTSAEIERPAAGVFAYATDPTRFSERQKGAGKILVQLRARREPRTEMPGNVAALEQRLEAG